MEVPSAALSQGPNMQPGSLRMVGEDGDSADLQTGTSPKGVLGDMRRDWGARNMEPPLTHLIFIKAQVSQKRATHREAPNYSL